MGSRRIRTNGEGTIYQGSRTLKNGTRAKFWVAEIEYLDPDKIVRRRRAQRPTQPEATKALHQLRLEVADLSRPRIPRKDRLVSEAVEAYLADTALRVDASSLATYRGIVERYLLPTLGRRRADSLRRHDIVAWIASLRESGVGDRTIQIVYQRAKAIIGPHVAHVRPDEHPFPVRGGPRVVETEIAVWSSDQMRTFVLGIEGRPHAAALLLGLTVGLRQSEVRGLRWGDVDLTSGAIRIVRSLSRATRTIKAPKTASGMRAVRLPPVALRALLAHQKEQKATGIGVGANDPIFATTRRGGVLSAPALYHALQRESERLGLPAISFHALRHSFATAALASGANPKVVQAVLGHADPAMLMRRYGHAIPGAETEVADRLTSLLESPRAGDHAGEPGDRRSGGRANLASEPSSPDSTPRPSGDGKKPSNYKKKAASQGS